MNNYFLVSCQDPTGQYYLSTRGWVTDPDRANLYSKGVAMSLAANYHAVSVKNEREKRQGFPDCHYQAVPNRIRR